MKPKSARTRPSRSRTAPRVSRRHRAAALAGIACTAVLLYINTLPNALVYDDLLLIPNSEALQDPWDVGAIFEGGYWGKIRTGAIYRPLTVWTLALNYRLNEGMGKPGAAPAGYHAANVLMHAVACCVLYLFLLRLPIPAGVSLITALLFAAHPIHTEAVAGIVGRAEVLALLFGTAFLLLHRRRRAPVAGALLYLLAAWGKESAIAFFPLAVVMDACFPLPSRRRPFGAYALYAGTAALWFLLRMQALGDAARPNPFIDNPLAAVNLAPLQRLCTAAVVQFKYLSLQVMPVGLSSDYSYKEIPVISTSADGRVIGFLLLFAVAAALAWRGRKRHPAVTFAVAGYAILFSTTSNVAVTIGTIMGERLAYAPSFCFCLLLAYGAWRLRQRFGRTAVTAATAVACLAFGILTVRRNGTWADELTFFRTQAQSAPHSAKAHYNYGAALAKTGDDRAAVREYRRALKIFPFYPEPLYNMGNALRRLDADADEVIAAYRGAIKYDRGHRQARAELASYLIDLGRKDEARTLLDELERLDPDYPSLAYLRVRIGPKASVSNPIGTTRLSPELQRGLIAFAKGDHAGAIPWIERALAGGALPPSMRKTALRLLARSYDAIGRPGRAAKYRRRADRLDAPGGAP